MEPGTAQAHALRSALLPAALLLISIPPAGAGAQPRAGDGADELRTLSVRGEGVVRLEPELARVQIGVRTEGREASDTVKRNTAQTRLVYQALEPFEIDPRDVRTTGFSIQPRQRRERERRGETYYEVRNTVLVTVRELERLGEVLDAVTGAGANTVSGLDFDVADRSEAQTRALESAVRDARARAEAAARSAGVELGEVRSIQSLGGAGPPVPHFDVAEGLAARSEVPISPGRMELRAAALVVYEIR